MNALAVDVIRNSARPRLARAIGRAIAPRKALTVSDWADAERVLSSKGSAKPGQWRTSRNPAIREPMDCMSKHVNVRECVLIAPIQMFKTEFALNVLGYTMTHDPCPIMVVLPDDISRDAWRAQKLDPMLDETLSVKRALTSSATRDSSNQKNFKDFVGGQLFIEHGKTLSRLALKSIKLMIVDEFDKFVAQLTGGEDPVEVLRGRFSSFPNTYKALFTGSPGIEGLSRLEALYADSDQRRLHVPCPHCGHKQVLMWSGLHWSPDGEQVFYACSENGCLIEEHEKTAMIAAGEWIPQKPDAKRRGYRINGLYYQIGMGPRWADLVAMWRAAQNDPAKLQVFITERLAEAWVDPAMRKVKHNVIADRAEPYQLRTAPMGVLSITVGVDTQDDRLEVHIVGWGRGLQAWTIDYVRLPGDPENDDVWIALVDLLNRPIEHASGVLMRPDAIAIDAGGHRTQAVYNFVRQHKLRRCIPIFGAVPNNAPVLSKGKLQDFNWRNQSDKRGIMVHHVGTVGIKHLLYSRISTDGDKPTEARMLHLSNELEADFFTGLVSETYNPRENRFVKRSGVRNEPLDTWVYAYAATHHPELRLHRRSKSEWDAAEARLYKMPQTGNVPHETIAPRSEIDRAASNAPAKPAARRGSSNFATRW